jgi:hypothetical protein
MNELGVDIEDMFHFFASKRNNFVGWSGVGCYHPLAYYLKWTLDDAKRIYVCGELISIDLDDLRYNQPPSHQLRTFIWRVNASIPFGRPIFGGDAIGCL